MTELGCDVGTPSLHEDNNIINGTSISGTGDYRKIGSSLPLTANNIRAELLPSQQLLSGGVDSSPPPMVNSAYVERFLSQQLPSGRIGSSPLLMVNNMYAEQLPPQQPPPGMINSSPPSVDHNTYAEQLPPQQPSSTAKATNTLASSQRTLLNYFNLSTRSTSQDLAPPPAHPPTQK